MDHSTKDRQILPLDSRPEKTRTPESDALVIFQWLQSNLPRRTFRSLAEKLVQMIDEEDFLEIFEK